MTPDPVASDIRNPVRSRGPDRRYAFRSAQLALDWQLLRNVSVKASLQRNLQTSNDPAIPFSATVATLDASLMCCSGAPRLVHQNDWSETAADCHSARTRACRRA